MHWSFITMYGKKLLVYNFVYTLCFTGSAFGWLKDVVTLSQHEVELSSKYSYSKAMKKGRSLTLEGHFKDALSFFKVALKKRPQEREAIIWTGNTYCTLGNVELGALGWASAVYETKKREKSYWHGENVKGKTIAIHTDWGLGDNFLFARYLQLLKKQGAKVIFAVPKYLLHIMSQCPYIDKVVDEKSIPSFDYKASITVLPYHFKTTLATIPNKVPYLYPDRKLAKMWKAVLSRDKNFKIGICWKGAYRPQKGKTDYRPIPLKELAPLFTLPGVSIYSLQQGAGVEEIDSFIHKDKLRVFGPYFDKTHGSFMDTAAVMKNLDLVITIDTSLCHLAGGLGVKVWTLLSALGDCRSFIKRSDNPWYPTMQLFRQTKLGDWAPVVAALVEKVRSLINTRKMVPLYAASKQLTTIKVGNEH